MVTGTLEDVDITVEGLFLNADARFDAESFRQACQLKEINTNICFNKRNGGKDRNEYFDKELYNERFAVEPTKAWMDSFRSLPNGFDTTTASWIGFNLLAFMVIALIKFKKANKKKV